MDQQLEYVLFRSLSEWIGFWPSVAVFVVTGVLALSKGADALVDGAANVGFRFGISATMIGLTIVAFGTSAPELVVSMMTAAQGRPEICLGNVIGSNIANTSLILGATALVFPLKIQKVSTTFDGPISFAAISMVFVMALLGDLTLSRFDGFLLLAVFATWMIWMNRSKARKAMETTTSAADDEEEVVFQTRNIAWDVGLIGVGLVGLVVGAKFLVAGSVETASRLGVSDIVVGLTVVAGGTSLPELAVCVAAALKRHADITVGNVLGSNIFNAWLILGTCLLIAPIRFDIDGFRWTGDAGTLFIDIPLCVLLCAAVIPLMRYKASLGRGRGALLIGFYVAYIGFLVWRNAG